MRAGRGVGGARQRRRRPRDGGRARPGRLPAGRPALPAAPGVALRRGARRLLLGLRQQRAVAALPHRLRAAALPARRLGAVPRRQPALRRGRARGGGRRAGAGVHPGLPPGAGARVLKEAPPRPAGRDVLAHPVAQPRGVPRPALAQELLDGLLANDLLGFHIRHHAINFLDAVAGASRRAWTSERSRSIAASRQPGCVRSRSAWTPRIVWPSPRRLAPRRELPAQPRSWAPRLHRVCGRGPARLHQGHPRAASRPRAILRAPSRVAGALAFIQIGVPSRDRAARVPAARRRGGRSWSEVNWKRRDPADGSPTVHLIERNLDFRELALLPARGPVR